jgi:hypothetical protein
MQANVFRSAPESGHFYHILGRRVSKGSDREDGVEAAAQVGLATPQSGANLLPNGAKGVLNDQGQGDYDGCVPARQSEHAVVHRHSRLRLPSVGIFHRAALCSPEVYRSRRPLGKHARLHAWRNRPDAVPAEEHTGLRHFDVAANALNSTANFRAHGWRAGAGYQPGEANFVPTQAWNAAPVYQRAVALMGHQIDGGEGTSAER